MRTAFNIIVHLGMLSLFAVGFWYIATTIRDTRELPTNTANWQVCPMCTGCGRVPPLPHVVE